MAADQAAATFSHSVATCGAAPLHHNRYVQERSFFETVVHLVACLEGIHYTSIGVGDGLGVRALTLVAEADRRNITPKTALIMLERLPESAEVAAALKAAQVHPHFIYLAKLRNVLFHRGLPGRRVIFTMPGIISRYDDFGDLSGPEITNHWADPLLSWVAVSIDNVLEGIARWLDRYNGAA